MDESFFKKIHHKSNYQLPPSYNREIGRVIVRWAFFEHQVQAMIWAIAFNDPLGAALGRLSTVEKRFPQRLDLLRQLAEVRRIGLDKTLLRAIRSKCEKLNLERNLLAHGCWTNHPSHGWLVRETRGEWAKSDDGPKGSRKVMPQSKPRDPVKIAQTVVELEKLIEETRALQNSLCDLR